MGETSPVYINTYISIYGVEGVCRIPKLIGREGERRLIRAASAVNRLRVGLRANAPAVRSITHPAGVGLLLPAGLLSVPAQIGPSVTSSRTNHMATSFA